MKTNVAAFIVLLMFFSVPAIAEDAVSIEKNESASVEAKQQPKCRWWQFHCSDQEREYVDGLPREAPIDGTLIAVDTSQNRLYLVKNGELIGEGPVATGSNQRLKRGIREWLFRTPRGRHKILRKIVDPVWTKPDWAFIEEGKPIPPPDSKKRQVKGKLGKYALDLGDGILIHGTDNPSSLGKNASHGCIRVGDDLLEKVYAEAKIGTEVYVF